jgi:hypothetical protein
MFRPLREHAIGGWHEKYRIEPVGIGALMSLSTAGLAFLCVAALALACILRTAITQHTMALEWSLLTGVIIGPILLLARPEWQNSISA